MELPLFPLHVVLFPGRSLPLNLFEPRYRQMLADCLAADRRFGVVAIRAGCAEYDTSVEIFDVGTVAEIEHVTETPDGRFEIITRGVERFRVRDFVPGTPYLKALVELLPEPPTDVNDFDEARQLRELLAPYLSMLGAPDELLERLPQSPNALAYLAAAAIHVEVPEQQRLLELDSPRTRLAATLAMLRRETSFMRHFGTVGSLRPPGPNGAQLN